MSLADVAKKYSFIKDLDDLPINFIYTKGYEEDFLQFIMQTLETDVRETLEDSRNFIIKELKKDV